MFGLDYSYFMRSKIYIHLFLLSVTDGKAVTGGTKISFSSLQSATRFRRIATRI